MAKILIVEDDPTNVEILERLLSRVGHAVLVAGNRHDAVHAATHESPDLILMDIGIPDQDGQAPRDDGGLEATRTIKGNDKTKSIPIIATSAFAMLDERQRFLEAGCDDVQSKPYDFPNLIQSIKHQLGDSD